MSVYPPLDVVVQTPRLELQGATDELLEQLAPVVRAGGATAEPAPWDDPSPFYELHPQVRVQKWMQGIWRGRGSPGPDNWRLYFVVVVDGEPIGMQDLIGSEFETFGTVETTSWIAPQHRHLGIGIEMRSAVLHLAFEGFGAKEAHSEAAVNNLGSNGVSRRLGYQRNGTAWATHQGHPVLGQRWVLGRSDWEPQRREDIAVVGLEACRFALGIGAS